MFETTELFRLKFDRTVKLAAEPGGDDQQRNRNPFQTPCSNLAGSYPGDAAQRIQFLLDQRNDRLRKKKVRLTNPRRPEPLHVRRTGVHGPVGEGAHHSTRPTLSTTIAQGSNKLEATARTDSQVSTSKSTPRYRFFGKRGFNERYRILYTNFLVRHVLCFFCLDFSQFAPRDTCDARRSNKSQLRVP